MADFVSIMHGVSAALAGGAAASGWTAGVLVANTAFDGLDHGRADRHLRKVLVATAGFQAVLLLAAAAAAAVTLTVGAASCAGLAALGLASNMWTLAPRKDKAPDGLNKKNSTMRVVAVSLTLIFTLVAAAAAILAALGI